MDDVLVRLGEGGRLVIPAEVRRRLCLGVGDELVLRVVDAELRITTLAAAVERAQRAVAPYMAGRPSPVEELIAERRAEATDE